MNNFINLFKMLSKRTPKGHPLNMSLFLISVNKHQLASLVYSMAKVVHLIWLMGLLCS